MMRSLVFVVLLLVLSAPLVGGVWIGHLGSDDIAYVSAGQRLLNEEAFVGDSHWAVRHPVTIPTAISFAVFGFGEIQSILPSVAYYVSTVVLIFFLVSHFFDRQTGFLSGLIVATTPLFVVWATILGPDISEAAFCVASLSLFALWREQRHRFWLLVLCGALAGVAFLNRETAAVLALVFGLYFLAERRLAYFLIGVGWLVPVGLETLYFTMMTGDPLYRLHTVFSSHGTPALHVTGEHAAGTGNLTNDVLIGPWAALFLNQEMALLFWAVVPAAWFIVRHGSFDGRQKRFLGLMAVAFFSWMFFDSYILGLRSLPRYFAVPAVIAAIMVGVWLRHLAIGRPVVACFIGSAILGSYLLALDLENTSPRLAERTVAALAADSPVYTTSLIKRRAEFFLIWQGASQEEVLAGQHLHQPEREETVLRGNPPEDALIVLPVEAGHTGGLLPPGWEEVERVEGERTLVGRLAGLVGLDATLIDNGLRRIVWSAPPVGVYGFMGPADREDGADRTDSLARPIQ